MINAPGRQYHTWRSPETDDSHEQGTNQFSLKNPPSMHLRETMVKRRVKTTDGYRTMECAMTIAEYEKKFGPFNRL